MLNYQRVYLNCTLHGSGHSPTGRRKQQNAWGLLDAWADATYGSFLEWRHFKSWMFMENPSKMDDLGTYF